MNKKTLVWVGIVVVVVIAAAVTYYSVRKASPANTGSENAAMSSGGSSATSSATLQALPTGSVTVPSATTTVSAGVAAPTLVTAGSPSGSTSYRVFDVTETANAFTPSTIIVNQGDTVHINITAQGGSYDFTQPDMGLKLSISSGQTKVVQFDADTVGKLTFYCASCGGPAAGPVGYIEVVGK